MSKQHPIAFTEYRDHVQNALADLLVGEFEEPDGRAATMVEHNRQIVREAYDNGVSVDAMAEALL